MRPRAVDILMRGIASETLSSAPHDLVKRTLGSVCLPSGRSVEVSLHTSIP